MVKSKFKITDIGIIPEDWEFERLGDFGKFKNGINKGAEQFGFGYPFVNLMDVFNKNTISQNVNYALINSNKLEQEIYNLKRGDTLFIRSSVKPSGVGIASVVIENLENIVYSGFLIRYRDERLDTNFKRYCFNSKYFRDNLINSSTVSANTNINQNSLSELFLAFPKSILEQQRIAEALSETDSWIESLENLIAKKRKLKQGTMQILLTPKEGWKVKKLDEISKITMGQSPLSKNYNTINLGLPLIQGNADIENRKTKIKNYSSQITKQGFIDDIIMTVRAPVGEVAKATFDCCLGRGVCAIRYPNDYLYHYLVFKENFWKQFSTGSTFDSVNSNQLKVFEVHLPNSTKEQIRIASILSDMDAEIENLEKKLIKAKQLKQGMMQQLLTGKIRLVNTLKPS